jgi:hypothetical protein
MEFNINRVKLVGDCVEIIPAQLTDDELIQLVGQAEFEATERGIAVPVTFGQIAVEGARSDHDATDNSPDNSEAPVIDPDEMKETISGLLAVAYRGHQATLEQTNGARRKTEQLPIADPETIAAEFEAWFDEPRLAYVTQAMQTQRGQIEWTLFATPNVTVSANEYLAATRAFGKDQPHRTITRSEIYKHYTPEEISGTDPSNGHRAKFKLVGNQNSPELASYEVGATSLNRRLVELQAKYPFLDGVSPLETLTLLNTQRASGDKLVGEGTEHPTAMRNCCFTLEPKQVGKVYKAVCVPTSTVFDDGTLFVHDTDIKIARYGYVFVG